MVRLEFPNSSHKSGYIDLLSRWKTSGELDTWHVSPGALFRGENFEEFLQLAQNDLTENHRWVLATLFFLMDKDRILWAIQIRHSIDRPNLREYGGHIWYGICPDERRKWYATEMLKLALIEAKNIWLEKVMLWCFDDNIGSIRTIEKNGGVFERYTDYDGKKSRVYWINIV
jgi:predicted acetyltransferase